MGLSLLFYLGDAARILAAVEDADIDLLDDPQVVSLRADLSLHIVPSDLNLLSRSMGAVSGCAPVDLRDHLTVLFDEVDCGLLEVDPVWIGYAAAVPVEKCSNVADLWVNAMNREHNDEGVLTDELVNAVNDLVTLCQNAKASKSKVLHAWFL